MRLSLKTKFTLATSLLVLAVVVVVSALYLARLMRQTLRQANDNAAFIAQQIYDACGEALREAAERGESPESLEPADLRDYARHAFDNSSTLNSLIESDVGISPTIYEITISDSEGYVLLSSDASLRDRQVAHRPPLASLVHGSLLQQLRELYGPPQTYESSLAFRLGAMPFGDIRVGLSSALIRGEISPGLITAAYWAMGAALLSTLLAFMVSNVALDPIEQISAQLDRIYAGHFDIKPVVARGDELGAVSTKIVGIGKQLQGVREILRLALSGRQTEGFAHEMKNPLNSMKLWLEVLKTNVPDGPEPQQALQMLDSEIERLDRVVRTYISFTKPIELKLEETDLRTVLEEAVDVARPSIVKAGLLLHVDFTSPVPRTLVDRQLIYQTVLNLLLNACDFTNSGGRISLTLQRSGENAVIVVEDTGRGIPRENREKIFQLFFTTRPGGTGIGLANACRFAQLHNGEIKCESEVGRGTRFRVELPLARPAEASETSENARQLLGAEKN